MVALVVTLLLLEVDDVGEVEEKEEEEETEVVETEKLVAMVEPVMMGKTMCHTQRVRYPFQVFILKMDRGIGMK